VLDVWRATGAIGVIDDVARAINESDDVVVIQGPPGTGKSWLAKAVGVMWESAGGSTIVADGDFLRSDEALYPFGFAMSGLPNAWRNVWPALAGAARVGEALLGTAGLVTTTVETIAKLHGSRHRARTVVLDALEQDIFHELESLGKKKPLLFVADNLHWWDTKSLELLGRLRDERLWEMFPFLAELRVVAAQTPAPYQQIANPDAFEAFLSPGTTSHFGVHRVSRDDFKGVLEALSDDTVVSSDTANAVYALSGGHLAIASQCAKRVVNGEVTSLLSLAGTNDFLHRVFMERIGSLGPNGKQALVVLQVAAVLGLTFRRDELLPRGGHSRTLGWHRQVCPRSIPAIFLDH